MSAIVKEEPVASSEEEEGGGEEEEWSGGDGNRVKLEEMEEDCDSEEDTGQKKNKRRKRSKRSAKALETERKWWRKRQELMKRVVAGEEIEGMGEEEKNKLLERWRKQKEAKKRSNEKRGEKLGSRKRGEYRTRDPNLSKEEKYKLRMEKERWRLLEKKLEMTEEDKEEERKKQYFRMKAWWDNMSEERKEEQTRKHRERSRRKWERIKGDEEMKRREAEKNKEWRSNLSEEKKRRYLESVYKSVRKMNERKKREDPEGWRKRNAEKAKQQWDKLDGEGKRRKLNMMKVYQQKRKLRGELEGMGVGKEEVKRRLDELDKRLREELGIGPNRPKGKRRKEVGLEEAGVGAVQVHEEKCEAGTSTSGGGTSDYFWNKEDARNYGAVHIQNPSMACEDNSEDYDGGGGDGDDFDDFDDEPPHLERPEVPLPPPPQEQVIPKLERHNLWTAPHPQAPPLLPPVKNILRSATTTTASAAAATCVLSVVPLPVPVTMKTFECTFCPVMVPRNFGTEVELKKHLRGKHEGLCWTCPICGEVVLDPKQLSEHFTAVHGNNPVKKNEKVEVSSSSSLSSSSLKAGGEVEFLCMKCPWKSKMKGGVKIFKDWRELHEHVKKKHKGYYWPCDKCHLLKYSKERLSLHKKICK